MKEEFYARPVFCVADVSASVRYYRDQLGFALAWSFPEDRPIIAQVGRNGLDIILDSHSAIPRASSPSVISMSLHEPKRLGVLHTELRERGARVQDPFETPWEPGLYQLDVRDPDGNVLIFWGEKPE